MLLSVHVCITKVFYNKTPHIFFAKILHLREQTLLLLILWLYMIFNKVIMLCGGNFINHCNTSKEKKSSDIYSKEYHLLEQ